MSDREIAARTKPRFIEIKPERRYRGPYLTPEQRKAKLREEEELRWQLIREFLDAWT